jgi:hypothetical protein
MKVEGAMVVKLPVMEQHTKHVVKVVDKCIKLVKQVVCSLR